MSLVLLGATGSIGTQTLEVAARLGIRGGRAGRQAPSDRMVALAEAHPDAAVVVVGGAREERRPSHQPPGQPGLIRCAGGGRPRRRTGSLGNERHGRLGRAVGDGCRARRREPAGPGQQGEPGGGWRLGHSRAAKGGGELVPVDSEHSAVLQCLAGEQADAVKRIILTASGGPFRGRTADRLAEVTPAEALRHPTWSMGRRITVDSATLMNKGLEVIEAHVLFGVGYDRIDVVVHPESIVHSMVEFVDGSVKAQIGRAGHEGAHPVRPDPSGAARRRRSPPLDLAGRSLTFERARP